MRRPTVVLAAFVALGWVAPSPAQQAIPDSIAADGVPAPPADVAGMLAKYQNGRTASFQDWASAGREVLYLSRATDTNQVYLAATPGGERRQLTALKERVGGAVARPGRNEFLISTDEGGAENYQVLLFDPAAGKSRRLTDGKSRNLGARWSTGGKLLAWSSNARNGKDMDLWVMDPEAPESARMFKQVSGSWSVDDWSPDDRKVAAVETISANESRVYVVDLASGETTSVNIKPNGEDRPIARTDVRFAKDGGSLFWTSDVGGEFLRLIRHDLPSNAETDLTSMISWDIESYDIADDGRTVVLAANEGGISRVHALDALTGQGLPGPKLPDGQIGAVKFRRGTREFGFSFSSSRNPGDVYSYDLDSRHLQRWTTSDTGGVDPSRFSEPELVRFDSFDDRPIPFFIYRPSKPAPGGRWPVLIDIHGGPEGQFRPGYLGRANALTEELGVAVIHPNVRGSTGYGKTYLKLDNGELREDSVKDIGMLLDWIARQPDLDRERVAVQGASYGGYMALAAMTHYNDRLKAGIDVVGISNWVTFLTNTQSYRRDLRRVEYGDERIPAMAEFLQRISPLNSAEKITRPLLVVQGQNDPRVPATESEQVVAKVHANGVPVWYVVGKNEGHGFAKKPNQDYQQAVQISFLRQYLVGQGKP